MNKKIKAKESILFDESSQNPQFDEELLEKNLITMEAINPSIFSVLMKYKNIHVQSTEAKKADDESM